MTTTPGLGWAPRFDERSRSYPIRTLITKPIKRRNKLWSIGPILDQGREGACVGFGWTAEALSTPVKVNLDRVKSPITPAPPYGFAISLYKSAQKIDEWEGDNYSGTSVLAGAKAMVQFGLLREYRWAFNIEDVTDAVLAKGPVVLGIPWYSGMYKAPGGVLSVAGDVVGGHCITVVGYRVSDPRIGGEDGFLLQNSWGAGWGENGVALIRKSDLEKLLANDGEACVPVRRSFGQKILQSIFGG